MLKKAVSQYTIVKQKMETNRKFYLTIFGMATAIILLWNGKITEPIFKDVFLITFAAFSLANVISKYLLQKK